ncbi:serine/threonine-protein kinase [Pseudonocardia sp. GCM10023141]|uniref:serine/threonine-protein kinase n=1 Tax=Pseudonocardia sp. GCM10023141 TaxID=3252653 RepID=UPI00360773FF
MEPLHADDPAALGPFRLLGRLGSGGMGQVYLGRNQAGRPAAIKVIHSHLAADPQLRARFEREISTAARVRAPWTAAVVDADPFAPQPWLATEFVPGPALDDAVGRTGPLPEHTLHTLAARLAEALAALHATRLVHRDLKPSNVLLAADGPRLIDFGIAHAVDATKITHTGHVIGTPAYMSPEQALGEATGPATDVFSLAAVLTYAATGVGPFGTTTNPVVMLRRVSVEAPQLAALPPGLRAVVEPCLAKDPAARPSAAQVSAMLGAPAAAGPQWLPPAIRTLVDEAALARPTRNRRVVGIAIAAVVAVLALAGFGGYLLANAVVPRPPLAAPAATAPAATPPPPVKITATPPPAAAPVALIPSTVPGWLAAVSSTRNVGYDVPPPWKPQSPGLIKGFETDTTRVLMSGVAINEADRPPPCPGYDKKYVLAWSGVTGSPTTDPSAAAGEVARLWSHAFDPDTGPQPTATIGAAALVTVAGKVGGHVVADIQMPAGSCGAPRKAVHAVALPSKNGQNVVWVLLAERDVPGAVTDADISQMITTLRPAGLEQKCDPAAKTVGSWC